MPEVPEEKLLETAPGESHRESDRLLAISAMAVAGCLTGLAACGLWLEAFRRSLPDARSVEYMTFLNLAIWGAISRGRGPEMGLVSLSAGSRIDQPLARLLGASMALTHGDPLWFFLSLVSQYE